MNQVIQSLCDFVAKYGDEMTDTEWQIWHRVLNRLELQADDERKKSQKTRKRLDSAFVSAYNSSVQIE